MMYLLVRFEWLTIQLFAHPSLPLPWIQSTGHSHLSFTPPSHSHSPVTSPVLVPFLLVCFYSSQVCFSLALPGSFTLYLFLLFTNAYRVMHEIEPNNVRGMTR